MCYGQGRGQLLTQVMCVCVLCLLMVRVGGTDTRDVRRCVMVRVGSTDTRDVRRCVMVRIGSTDTRDVRRCVMVRVGVKY